MKKTYWENYTDPIPPELLAALRRGRLVAFVGAGVSSRCLSKNRSPLPNWPVLLSELIAWGISHDLLDKATAVDLRQLHSRKEFLMLAQECRDRFGDERLAEFINEVFNPSGIVPARVHDLLAAVPFYGYVTTNYDNLLERAFMRVHNRALRLVAPDAAKDFFSSPQRSLPLLKLHGDIDDPASIVLAHRDYQRLVWDPAYSSFVQSLLGKFTLLFVGYNLSDLDILFPLDKLAHDGASFEHFLLSQRGVRNAVEKKRLLLDRHIKVIEYVDYFGFHNHVDTFIDGVLLASGNGSALARARTPIRARVHISYAQEDQNDGMFVWNYVFREGAITRSLEPQQSQWKVLRKELSRGLPCLDYLVLLVSPRSLMDTDMRNVIIAAHSAAMAAGSLVIFLAVQFSERPKLLAQLAPQCPIFIIPRSFGELDLEPFRQYLAEDIKGGYRQP